MKNLFLALIGCLFLTGCATSGSPKVKDASLLAQINKGVTTQSEVLSIFGEPQVRKTKENGLESWDYTYVETEVTGATFIPIVGIFAGGANSTVNGIEVDFDSNDVVKSYTTSTGSVKSQNFGKTDTQITKTEH